MTETKAGRPTDALEKDKADDYNRLVERLSREICDLVVVSKARIPPPADELILDFLSAI